ncbi:MAG: hypothetical protein U0166_28665 [Acidobacteriota bacterium]
MANAEKTPNPAKAPWYFLGLQELLHYYPPLVSGVVLPGLVVMALAVIPYFDVNIERASMWRGAGRGRTLAVVLVVVAALSALFLTTGAHPVWPVVVPLWVVAFAMCLPAFSSSGGALGWMRGRGLDFWVFLWFLLSAACLTTIGTFTFFRGPGWTFTLPWRDRIF